MLDHTLKRDDDPQGAERALGAGTGLTDGRTVETRLFHDHLPRHQRLEQSRGSDTAEIARGPEFDGIAPVLRILGEHERELPEDWL